MLKYKFKQIFLSMNAFGVGAPRQANGRASVGERKSFSSVRPLVSTPSSSARHAPSLNHSSKRAALTRLLAGIVLACSFAAASPVQAATLHAKSSVPRVCKEYCWNDERGGLAYEFSSFSLRVFGVAIASAILYAFVTRVRRRKHFNSVVVQELKRLREALGEDVQGLERVVEQIRKEDPYAFRVGALRQRIDSFLETAGGREREIALFCKRLVETRAQAAYVIAEQLLHDLVRLKPPQREVLLCIPVDELPGEGDQVVISFSGEGGPDKGSVN